MVFTKCCLMDPPQLGKRARKKLEESGEKVVDGGKSWYLEYGWADDLLVQRFAPDLICMVPSTGRAMAKTGNVNNLIDYYYC